VVFVADDFGAWLVALLADAGRRKRTALVLGSEQERALQKALRAAVELTTGELDRSGGGRGRQLAMVINEVFGDPVPGGLLTGRGTLLEGLHAGIAGMLAPLDDPSLTGTGASSAEVLRVPVEVLAERLAGHLVREIMVRGSRGGPLAPLAVRAPAYGRARAGVAASGGRSLRRWRPDSVTWRPSSAAVTCPIPVIRSRRCTRRWPPGLGGGC
jgi:hypothetical protein